MIPSLSKNRSPRLTRSQLRSAEADQSAVIAALIATGVDDIARRLERCQRERQNRHRGWPWRCHGSGCWSCRRALIRRWWKAFHDWLDDCDVSLAIVPLSGDLISASRKLRKGLRDVRDRAARHDHRWKQVAFGGLADGNRFLILIQHNNIDRDEVWETLERRWPEIILCNPGTIEPSRRMSVEDTLLLALRRRNIQGIRITVMPRIAAVTGPWGEPMPMTF